MSILNRFPTLRPSLNLDFANTGVLDPRVTFARASTARYYDASTVAKAEENLVLQSEDFTNAVWVNGNTSVTGNTTTAPNGTSTADTLAEDVSVAVHNRNQAFNSVNGRAYTFSVFFKKGTGASAKNYIQLSFGSLGFGSGQYANFDISVGGGTSGTVLASSGGTAAISAVGNDWYRCSWTATATATVSTVVLIYFINSPTALRAPGFAGDVGSDVFLWGAQLEQRSAVTAYTPTTTQPITNYIPVLMTAAANVPRFDYDPVTLQARGLLIEEQRANLCLQSEDFGTTWATSNGTDVINQIVAPNGTLTGDLFQENTVAGVHGWDQAITTVASTTYTLSVYAKYAGRYLRLSLNESSDTALWAAATYDLSLGTVLNTNAAAGGTVTSTSITAVGNGWYRCVLTGNIGANTNMRVLVTPALNTATYTTLGRGREAYTGDGTSGIYIWGAQLEAGAFPTSYIPTTTTALTRSADVASMTGTNFSSWYNASEGTVYTQAIGVNNISGGIRRYVEIGSGSTNERIVIGYSPTTSTRFLVVNDGTTQADVAVTTGVPAGSLVKMASAYKANDFQQASNGTLGIADTSGTLPTATAMSFGTDSNASAANFFLNGHIQRIAYYKYRLSNAQLQELTRT